jgi:hypothetical protein
MSVIFLTKLLKTLNVSLVSSILRSMAREQQESPFPEEIHLPKGTSDEVIMSLGAAIIEAPPLGRELPTEE